MSKLSAQIIDFAAAKKKALDSGSLEYRAVAKKIVAAYHEHGEDAYFNALLSVTQGDSKLMAELKPYLEAEIKSQRKR